MVVTGALTTTDLHHLAGNGSRDQSRSYRPATAPALGGERMLGSDITVDLLHVPDGPVMSPSSTVRPTQPAPRPRRATTVGTQRGIARAE